MYGVELMIIVLATVASTLSANLESGVSVFAILGAWRILLGIGIGGDYPLSAIITSEFATRRGRGPMMAAVFAMQGFGILAAALVSLGLLAAFKQAILADSVAEPRTLDRVWRLCIAAGALPALLAIYFRLNIPESPRFTIDVERNIERAVRDINGALGREASTSPIDNIGGLNGLLVCFHSWLIQCILIYFHKTMHFYSRSFFSYISNLSICISCIAYYPICIEEKKITDHISLLA